MPPSGNEPETFGPACQTLAQLKMRPVGFWAIGSPGWALGVSMGLAPRSICKLRLLNEVDWPYGGRAHSYP